MTLQTSITANNASNASNIQARAVLNSLTMNAIDSKITTESERTDLDERTYKITLELNADINGRMNPVEIIQSDSTRILIQDVVSQLIDKGYRVAYKAIKTRDGKPDRVKLQIAWG